MLQTLWLIFKGLLLVFGIMVVLDVIIGMILSPFKKKKEREQKEKFISELDKIANECIEELMKEQEKKPKKTTKNTKKSKEN